MQRDTKNTPQHTQVFSVVNTRTHVLEYCVFSCLVDNTLQDVAASHDLMRLLQHADEVESSTEDYLSIYLSKYISRH